MIQEVFALPFQKQFLTSQARYPALISGIGTGKTFMLLLKIWDFCNTYPNSLALIVRKEYTDLKDSTIKDFQRYFSVTISSDKDYKFDNGSIIMFRHAAEIEVLKNINLSIFGIEQAEEFETEEQFTFLRDRLRRDNAPYRQGCIIANACGHNWIWRLWVNNPQPEFKVWTATTFDNADNLPKDFVEDLRRMEIESPNHFKQYVMNSFEEVDADDLLFSHETIYSAPKLIYGTQGTRNRILAVDVARFGEDETVFTVLQSNDIIRWEQIHQEFWKHHNLMEVVGKVVDMRKEFGVEAIVIDDSGLGGGVTDRLGEMKYPVYPFNGGEKASNVMYANKRSEGYFRLKEQLEKRHLKLLNDSELLEQLMTIKYKFRSGGEKFIVSKDDMRKEGLKSPDRADALMMAMYYADDTFKNTNIQQLPQYKLQAVFD